MSSSRRLPDARHLKAAQVAFVSGEGLEGRDGPADHRLRLQGQRRSPSRDGVNTRTMDGGRRTTADGSPTSGTARSTSRSGSPISRRRYRPPIRPVPSAFKANAEALSRRRSTRLNAYAHSKFDAVPADRRKVLTSHDAFGYFGREYNVSFLSAARASRPKRRPRPADVAKLIQQIKAEHVKTYFLEEIPNDPRLVRQVAKATGCPARRRALCRIALGCQGAGADLRKDVPLQCRPDRRGDGEVELITVRGGCG